MGDDLPALETAARPTHVPHLVASWPAVHAWSAPGGLAAALTAAAPPLTPLDVVLTSDGAAGAAAFETITLAQFASDVDTGISPRYLAQVSLDGDAPLAPLRAATPTPTLLTSPAPLRAVLWVSAGPHVSSPHYDEFHGLICVAVGSKTVTLAPPAARVAPRPPTGDAANHCDAVNLDGVYGAITVKLQAGDALFIPEGWWHAVVSTPRTAALTFWWRSPAVAALAATPAQAAYLVRLACRQLAEGEDSGDEDAGGEEEGVLAPAVAAARAGVGAAALTALQTAASTSPAAVAHAASRLPPRAADALAGALDSASPSALATLQSALGDCGDALAAALLSGRQAAGLARLGRRLARVLGSDAARAEGGAVGMIEH